MSSSKESNCCPDGYRALSTSELKELLQNDDKMDQIIRLNEKVRSAAFKVLGGICALLTMCETSCSVSTDVAPSFPGCGLVCC